MKDNTWHTNWHLLPTCREDVFVAATPDFVVACDIYRSSWGNCRRSAGSGDFCLMLLRQIPLVCVGLNSRGGLHLLTHRPTHGVMAGTEISHRLKWFHNLHVSHTDLRLQTDSQEINGSLPHNDYNSPSSTFFSPAFKQTIGRCGECLNAGWTFIYY
jgi:hypothetical protein